MNAFDILPYRLESQLLLPQTDRTIQEVVSRMGALQAQDYAMMKWAIGSRAKGSTETEVESALDRGEILRTHVLRPTWHVVSAKDIRWMLALTAPRIRISMRTRDAQLGLSESIINRSKTILVKALEGGHHKTKEELNVLWNKASIPTTEYRDAHLLMHAELDGLACSGISIGKNRSYALLDERVPFTLPISKEEALAKLAKTYFTGRCPASMQDFIWWSGLTVGDARLAIESIKPEFHLETIGLQTFVLPNKMPVQNISEVIVHPIPAFDEFLIAYRDRTAALIPEQFIRVVSNNGFFRPVLLLNGKVIGIWKRINKRNTIEIDISLFDQQDQNFEKLINEAFINFGRFHERMVKITFTPYSFK